MPTGICSTPMDDAIIKPPTTAITTVGPQPRGKARAESRRRKAFSDNTLKQYSSLWGTFQDWWSRYAPHRDPVDVTDEEVTWYLAEREQDGKSYATLLADYNAIDFVVRRAGRPTLRKSAAVREFLMGFRREEDTGPRQKRAITIDVLSRMVAGIPTDTLIGLRDRALLVVGWNSAQRREELCRMTLRNLTGQVSGHNYFIYIPWSKTDQEGKGRETIIYRHPVWGGPSPADALDAWLAAMPLPDLDDPIFCGLRSNRRSVHALGGEDVARIVRSRAFAIPDDPTRYGGHSLRSGFVTEMHMRGMSFDQIAAYTGHQNLKTVQRYNRPREKVYPIPTQGADNA